MEIFGGFEFLQLGKETGLDIELLVGLTVLHKGPELLETVHISWTGVTQISIANTHEPAA